MTWHVLLTALVVIKTRSTKARRSFLRSAHYPRRHLTYVRTRETPFDWAADAREVSDLVPVYPASPRLVCSRSRFCPLLSSAAQHGRVTLFMPSVLHKRTGSIRRRRRHITRESSCSSRHRRCRTPSDVTRRTFRDVTGGVRAVPPVPTGPRLAGGPRNVCVCDCVCVSGR